jgi:hypothetical protein
VRAEAILARLTVWRCGGAYAIASIERDESLLNGSPNSKFTSLVSTTTDMEEHQELVAIFASSRSSGAEEKSMSKRVNRKMDTALLPLLSLLYLFNGLDRSNVGNAETQGMPNLRLLII